MGIELNEVELKTKVEKISSRLVVIAVIFFLICLSISLFFVGIGFKVVWQYILSLIVVVAIIGLFYFPTFIFIAFFKEQLKLKDFTLFELKLGFFGESIFVALVSHFTIIANLDVLLYQLKLTKGSITRRIIELILTLDDFGLSFLYVLSPLILIITYVIIKILVYGPNEKKKEYKQKIQLITERLQSEGWILKSEWNRETQRAIDFKSENGQDWVKVE
jgi:hypothetical protein